MAGCEKTVGRIFGEMSIRTYRLDSGEIEQRRPKLALQATITVAVLVVGMMGFYFFAVDSNVSPEIALPIIGAVVLLFVGNFAFSLNKKRRIANKQNESYLLTIYDDRILREIEGVADIEISKENITKVTIYKDKGFSVQGRTDESLFVPDILIGYHDVLTEVTSLCPPVQAGVLSKISPYVLVIVMMGLFVTFAKAETITPVLLSGIPIVCMCLWASFAVFRNETLPAKTRRMGLAVLLPAVGVIGKIIVVLQGGR
jgi:hypothetical protein